MVGPVLVVSRVVLAVVFWSLVLRCLPISKGLEALSQDLACRGA